MAIRSCDSDQLKNYVAVRSSGLTNCQKKVLDVVFGSPQCLYCWGAGSGKSFLIKQISECTTKTIYVTNTTGRAAKVLKNKAKTIHSFAEIGDCHEPKEVCCVFHVLCGCFFAFSAFRKTCLNKLEHAF